MTMVSGVLLGCGGAAPQPNAQPASAATESLCGAQQWPDAACVPLEWSAAPGMGERAGILVPVRFGKVTLLLQLDTGSNRSFLYGRDVLRRHGWQAEAGSPHDRTLRSGALGGKPFENHPFLVLDEMRESSDGQRTLSGTAGLDLLAGAVTLIDMQRQRVCVVETPRAELTAGFATVDARIDHEKLFIAARVGQRAVPNLFYDSGASAFSLVVDYPDWKLLTGQEADAPGVRENKAMAWGRALTVLSAPLAEPLMIGELTLPDAQASFVYERPTMFSHFPFPARGLIGNRPFFDRAVLLDLRPGQTRFGISTCGQAASSAGPVR
jgi:hypothetical protein